MISAIILAAGKSTRFGKQKKQFLEINGKTVLERSVKKFIDAKIDEIVIATLSEKVKYVENMFKNTNCNMKIVHGGTTRFESVKKALTVCTTDGFVLIHDAARPFVSVEKINELIETVKKTNAATLAIPVNDSAKFCENNLIKKTIPRNNIFLTQTPQAFSKELYFKALELNKLKNIVDDCQLVEQLNIAISIVIGEKNNFKITSYDDLVLASFLASKNL